MATPRAQDAYERFYATLAPAGRTGRKRLVHGRLATHWARLVELLYAAERMLELVSRSRRSPRPTSDVVPTGTPTEGVGTVEAPRGTLTHHYWTDERGILTRVNLIVGTTNNYAPIAMSVERAARGLIHGGQSSARGCSTGSRWPSGPTTRASAAPPTRCPGRCRSRSRSATPTDGPSMCSAATTDSNFPGAAVPEPADLPPAAPLPAAPSLAPPTAPPRTLVVGLGNPLLGDDGVGWRVVDLVEARLAERSGQDGRESVAPPCFELDRLAVGGLALMERLVGYERAILVDAIATGVDEPGTVRVAPLAEVVTRAASHLNSAHDAPLTTALDAGRSLGADLPSSISVVTDRGRAARHLRRGADTGGRGGRLAGGRRGAGGADDPAR